MSKYATYNQAKKWCRDNNVTSHQAYKLSYKEADIKLPSTLNVHYKNEWEGSREFFGSHFAPYKDLIKWIKKNKIKSVIEYRDTCKSAKINIPTRPEKHYPEITSLIKTINQAHGL